MKPEDLFPLAAPAAVTCGLRADLPKTQRRHDRIYLGTDPRHTADGRFEDLHVYACAICGRDMQTRKPPGELPWPVRCLHNRRARSPGKGPAMTIKMNEHRHDGGCTWAGCGFPEDQINDLGGQDPFPRFGADENDLDEEV